MIEESARDGPRLLQAPGGPILYAFPPAQSSPRYSGDPSLTLDASRPEAQAYMLLCDGEQSAPYHYQSLAPNIPNLYNSSPAPAQMQQEYAQASREWPRSNWTAQSSPFDQKTTLNAQHGQVRTAQAQQAVIRLQGCLQRPENATQVSITGHTAGSTCDSQAGLQHKQAGVTAGMPRFDDVQQVRFTEQLETEAQGRRNSEGKVTANNNSRTHDQGHIARQNPKSSNPCQICSFLLCQHAVSVQFSGKTLKFICSCVLCPSEVP